MKKAKRSEVAPLLTGIKTAILQNDIIAINYALQTARPP
jgi:hypothetical protein